MGDNTILYLPKTNGVPKCLHAIRRQIIAEQKYEDRFYNHDLDDFAICINDGHYLPEHVDLIRDKENSTYEHNRANWVVSAPEFGGHIVDDDSEYIPEIGKIYYVNAKKSHSVTMVKGDTPLILYSFGFVKRHSNYV